MKDVKKTILTEDSYTILLCGIIQGWERGGAYFGNPGVSARFEENHCLKNAVQLLN